MRKFVTGALALSALALGAAPALAHHSFAMFDTTKQVNVTGTVKEFQYTNPHSWILIVVPGANGEPVEWGFESEGPSSLLRIGVKPTSLKPGDKVTARAFPMRDGRPAGALISITKPDGAVLSFRQNPPPAAAPTPGN